MDRYIQQLIEDLRMAATQVPEPGEFWEGVDMENPAEVEDMAYVKRHFEDTPRKLSEIVGIEKIVFPPPKSLTKMQSTILSLEMTRLLKAYHFVPEFPQGLPGPEKYKVLRDHWESEQIFIDAGETDLEFCDCDTASCPFPMEFCDCLKAEEEENDAIPPHDESQGDDELPF